MQLNELLENYSLKDIAKKTNISEENLDVLFNKEFEALTKVKAMGFISIVEREFKADLSALRKEAKSYYEKHGDEVGVVLEAPVVAETKSGAGKVVMLLVLLGVIVGGGWYLSTRFDRTNFDAVKSLWPFGKSQGSKSENRIAVEPEQNGSVMQEAVTVEMQEAEQTN